MAWSFDIRTALLLGAFLTTLIGVLLFLVRRHLATSLQPALRWWIAATLLQPVGFLLIGLRGQISEWWSTVFSNGVIALAFSCFAVSLRVFNGSPQRRERFVVLIAITLGLAYYFGLAHPDIALRIGTVSIVFAILLGSSARAIYRRGQAISTINHVTGGLFALGTVLMAYRAGVYLFQPPPATSIFVATPLQVLTYGMGGLLPVVSTVGFLLMCTERSQMELSQAARLDYLTGICNRRAIDDLASRAIAAARRHGMPLAMMIVDVDHFKRINDELGHEAGDQALVETVKRIREGLRTEDLVGRLGGEEFIAVMPNTDGPSALAAAERVRSAFGQSPMAIAGASMPVTVSVGVALLQAEDRQFSTLLRRADRAMYAAKAAGRNRVMLDATAI